MMWFASDLLHNVLHLLPPSRLVDATTVSRQVCDMTPVLGLHGTLHARHSFTHGVAARAHKAMQDGCPVLPIYPQLYDTRTRSSYTFST